MLPIEARTVATPTAIITMKATSSHMFLHS